VALATPSVAIAAAAPIAPIALATRSRAGGIPPLVCRTGPADIHLITREPTALVAPHVADVATRIDPFSASRHQGTSCRHRDHRRLQG
jgi:hypothetical protein